MSNIAELASMPDVSFIDWLTLAEVKEMYINLYKQHYKSITGNESTLSAADPVQLVLMSLAESRYQELQYIDRGGKANLLKYSYGTDLDNIATRTGLRRKEAQQSQTVLKFTLSGTFSSAIGIPSGTRVRTEAGVYFATSEYAEVAAGQTVAEVTARAELAGASADGIAAGELNVLVDPIPYMRSVENVSVTSGGTDTETDDALTERVYYAPSAYSSAGPLNAYIYYAKAWRNDVADVVVTNPSDCEVGVYFMLSGGEAPSEADRDAMEEYLSGKTMRPMCDHVQCYTPTEIDCAIAFTYYIARSDSNRATDIQAAVGEAVTAYKAWQRIMGRDINPTELIYRVRAAGAKRVVLANPIYKVVTDTQIAKPGAPDVTYGGLEDD